VWTEHRHPVPLQVDSTDQCSVGQQVGTLRQLSDVYSHQTGRTLRITIHNASWDYEGSEPRHGTRVTSLAEEPYYDAAAPSRRLALGLDDPE